MSGKVRWLAVAALAGLGFVPAYADEKPGAQTAEKFEKQVPVKLDYLLYLPADYKPDGDKKWPVIMFLHGAGERGTDIAKVKVHGPPKLLAAKTDLAVKDFIVISPQCPPNKWWQPDELMALLDEVAAKHNVDPERIYLTGLSMGGFGTWEIAARYANRFAAIAPICGGGNPRRVREMKNLPIWVFHGEKDPVVAISQSEEMVEALKKAGADPKFTRYPEAAHDSWTETYNNPELYKWFLEHKRGEGK